MSNTEKILLNRIKIDKPDRFFGPAFINGGPVTMIYGFIFSFLGALATCASLAEMASMCED